MSEKLDRADKVLVALGHFESRAAAQAAIEAGLVSIAGRVLTKPSEKISPAAKIKAEAAHPWVSRAGVKLDHALKLFGIDVSGKLCLDIGASTGGFTEVLLASGAASVISIDVGRDQLHPRLRKDPRVTSLEGQDARTLTRAHIPEPPEILVCDASFISLHKLLTVPLSLAAPGADLIALFKPQFEVGREFIGKGGIVTDIHQARLAEDSFCEWLQKKDWEVFERDESPIKGSGGNAERLLHAKHDL